jgi:nucleolar protein 58
VRPSQVRLRLAINVSGCLQRLKLKALHRFTSTATAVEDLTSVQDGKLGKGLKKFLSEEVVDKGKGKESLLVIDPHLGMWNNHPSSGVLIYFPAHSISKKLGIKVSALSPDDHSDLWRGIRAQIAALMDGLDPKDLATMSLGLSHSLSR